MKGSATSKSKRLKMIPKPKKLLDRVREVIRLEQNDAVKIDDD